MALAAALVLLGLLAVRVPAAAAGTVSVNGSMLTYVAAPGDFNILQLSADTKGDLVVTEFGPAALDVGPGCSGGGPSGNVAATCAGAGVTGASFSLGDLDDQFDASQSPIPVTVDGGDGDDSITGSPGNDALEGGPGTDTIDGGGGADTASYADHTSGMQAELSSSNGEDTLLNVENLVGGSGDDTLIGDGGANVIEGGPGADSIDGGDGTDTVSYADHTSGVTAVLSSSDGEDTIGNVENLAGSPGADTLVGDGSANAISGGAGNDTLRGGGGADTLDGGDGSDTVDESDQTAGVAINLAAGVAADDHIAGIENAIGGAGNDQITGDAGTNRIDAGPGDDTINTADVSVDVIDCGPGTDTIAADGRDTLTNCDTKLPLPLALAGRQVTPGTVSVFTIGCPITAVTFCQGTLVVRQFATRLSFGGPQPSGAARWIAVASAPFQIAAGTTGNVRAVFTTPPSTPLGKVLASLARTPLASLEPSSSLQTSAASIDAVGYPIVLGTDASFARATPLQVTDLPLGLRGRTLGVRVRCGANARPGCTGTVQLWSLASGPIENVPVQTRIASATLKATKRLQKRDLQLTVPKAALKRKQFALVVSARDGHSRSVAYKHAIVVRSR
jgi:Ca2+-binding RTX toxin-like protein